MTRIFPGWLPLFAALALAGALQATLNVGLQGIRNEWRFPEQERSERWNAPLFKAATFSHWPAAVDWVWLTVLVDPSISRVPPGSHPAVYYHLDLISELDPAYFEVYPAGANLLAVVRSDGAGARDLLLKGDRFAKERLPEYPAEFAARYWPTRWQIPLLLAYTYLFELSDMPHAAERFEEASRLPGAPAYLSSLALRLQKVGGQYDVGVRLLEFMLSANPRDEVREELERKLAALKVSRLLFHANRAFAEYRALPRVRRLGLPDDRALASFLRENPEFRADPSGPAVFWDGVKRRIDSPTPHSGALGLD